MTYKQHLPCLLMGVAVPVLAALLTVVGGGTRIAFWAFPQFVLPESCFSRALLGIDCPGCGLTRSIVYLVHGDLSASLAMHRLGWLVLAAIVWQVPYRLWCMRRPAPRSRRYHSDMVLLVVICLLCLNRVWDIVAAL